MKFLKQLTIIATTCVMLSLHAEEVILENEVNELVSIEVGEDDSFLTILEWIRDQFKTPKQIREENEIMAVSEMWDGQEDLKIEIAFSDKIIVSKSAKKSPFRNYFVPLTQQEKDDIAYIVTTLNDHTFITLVPYRSSIKKAGSRVDHLHPFRFMEAIFTDENLAKCAKNIVGKTFVWGKFLKGITSTLKEETKKGNVLPDQLADFAATIGIDLGLIYKPFEHQDWEEMVLIIINTLAKKSGKNINI